MGGIMAVTRAKSSPQATSFKPPEPAGTTAPAGGDPVAQTRSVGIWLAESRARFGGIHAPESPFHPKHLVCLRQWAMLSPIRQSNGGQTENRS